MTKLSNSFGGIVFGIPEKSKHSLLQYWSSRCWFLSSSTISSFVFWNASCKTFYVFFEMSTSIDNFSFCFTKKSNLEIISSNFWFISLFCSRISCCCTRIFSCNTKNVDMIFSLLIFSSCPLVRIFDAWLIINFVTLITYVRSAWCLRRG